MAFDGIAQRPDEGRRALVFERVERQTTSRTVVDDAKQHAADFRGSFGFRSVLEVLEQIGELLLVAGLRLKHVCKALQRGNKPGVLPEILTKFP